MGGGMGRRVHPSWGAVSACKKGFEGTWDCSEQRPVDEPVK